jgi:broad specificity phosphatase PhoE
MADATQRVFLIRHGETPWSLSGQHTSRTDIALTDKGRAVALRLAPLLAAQSFERVFTSPMQRARQTCELAGLGEHAQIDAELREWDYGEYEGLTSRQIREKIPDWVIFRDGCPGGETPAAIGARADRMIDKIRAVQGNVAVFAHGHVLRVLGVRWLGLSVAAGSQFLLDTGTSSVLSYYYGTGAIERWNSTT